MIRNICDFSNKSIGSRGEKLFYIVLNAQKLYEFFLIAGEARLEAKEMNDDCLDHALIIVLIAVDIIGGAQNLSVDSSVIIHNFEELVEELNPLLLFGKVDGVAELLVKEFRFDDHRDNARHDELKSRKDKSTE